MDFKDIIPEKFWVFDNITDIDPNGEFLTTRVSVLEKLGKYFIIYMRTKIISSCT